MGLIERFDRKRDEWENLNIYQGEIFMEKVEKNQEHKPRILTISEMAKICRVSRQTLIYYDKQNILKPTYIDDNGYRYYSIYQVPFLREICALKEKNFALKDIVQNLSDRKVENMVELLEVYQGNLDEQIRELNEKKAAIADRMQFYKNAQKELAMVEQPYIKIIPGRKLLFLKWGTEKVNRSRMHMVHMMLRNQAEDLKVSVDFGWGALLWNDSIQNQTPLAGAGGYVMLPEDFVNDGRIPAEQYVEVPACYFACMNVYAMPYDTTYLGKLYSWISENHYEVLGDLINECILDTTFYTEDQKADFCQLQVPIHIPGLQLNE